MVSKSQSIEIAKSIDLECYRGAEAVDVVRVAYVDPQRFARERESPLPKGRSIRECFGPPRWVVEFLVSGGPVSEITMRPHRVMIIVNAETGEAEVRKTL